MSGPRPTPTRILKLRGSWRAKKRGQEPQPEIAVPVCPAWLCDVAKAEWVSVTDELLELGISATIDHAQVEGYCVAYARWVDAEHNLKEQGAVVRSPSGYPIQNPYLSIANEALRQLRLFAAELGLSPSARTKIHVQPRPAPDDFERFLRGEYGVMKRNRKA
jgi:P27 family predicted phage terminase small subunit